MSSSENLIKATLKLLTKRFGEELINATNTFKDMKENVPNQLKKEWQAFQKEVFEEADRLQQKSEQTKDIDIDLSNESGIEGPQQKIDKLRAKVAELNRKVEVGS